SLRHSVDNCQNRDALSPNKKIDLYEVARIDPELPIENIMINLITLRDEGKYMDIACRNIKGLFYLHEYVTSSIAAVEVKVSAWEYGEEQKDLIPANTQLGVAGLAHSPLGQKLLTGTITKSLAYYEDMSGTSLARWNIIRKECKTMADIQMHQTSIEFLFFPRTCSVDFQC
ncbi:hypothetical protein DFH05DRAFT_1566268, partial [Lentinula detonsa]